MRRADAHDGADAAQGGGRRAEARGEGGGARAIAPAAASAPRRRPCVRPFLWHAWVVVGVQELRKKTTGGGVDARKMQTVRAGGAEEKMPPLYPAGETPHYTYFYTAETPASVMDLLSQQFSLLAGETREVPTECVAQPGVA